MSMVKSLLLFTILASLGNAGEGDQVSAYINDIKSGPAIYYTPEAAAFYATEGNYSGSTLSVNKDAAIRTFLATIKLGGMQLGQTREAISVLIDIFPKAVHFIEIRQARFSGKGTFDDCVSTYAMSSKNQFMLSSPILDYNSLSLCEGFIESHNQTEIIEKRVGKSGAIVEALFNLKMTFTFYAGECALSRITGMSLGHDPSAWRQWWLTTTNPSGNTEVTYSPYPPASGATMLVTAAEAYADIVVGGKYRVFLNTGDELVGTVESRSDTSMVLETTEGKPFSFRFSLVTSYQVIEKPKPQIAPQGSAPASSGAEIISYDELKQRAAFGPDIEVKIANGSLFRGKLLSIDDDGLKMNVEGSTIPIAKDVIKQIIAIPVGYKQGVDSLTKERPKPQGPFDTLWTKNPQTDSYGKRLADILNVGTIIDEGDNYVTLKMIQGGAPKKFSRNEITRFIRQSADKTDDAISRYAKALACPGDMFRVDMPPERIGKPFFKVCVDRYEYPNKVGNVPRTAISFSDAKKFCEQQGKRLCTAEEWQWACSGPDGLTYPYGKNFEQDRCNNDTRLIETSGNRINCTSPFGGFDMAGNVFEWVNAPGGKPALMGGPFSKCQTISPGESGDAKPQSGLRCCKSN